MHTTILEILNWHLHMSPKGNANLFFLDSRCPRDPCGCYHIDICQEYQLVFVTDSNSLQKIAISPVLYTVAYIEDEIQRNRIEIYFPGWIDIQLSRLPYWQYRENTKYQRTEILLLCNDFCQWLFFVLFITRQKNISERKLFQANLKEHTPYRFWIHCHPLIVDWPSSQS